MKQKEKLQKIEAINKMILDLKLNPTIKSKTTIQKLQQERDKILGLYIHKKDDDKISE
jgi:hypothetical protein